eukprot:gene27179-32835_t
MVKESISVSNETHEDLQTMLYAWFGSDSVLKKFELLKGGYSCTNYLLITADDNKWVLKICKGYDTQAVELQANLAAYLFDHGFLQCCHPFRIVDTSDPAVQYSSKIAENPAILVNYIYGKAGDYLVEQGIMSLNDAARKIGRGLASMHAIPLPATSTHTTCTYRLRSYKDDGICFLGRHLTGQTYAVYNEHAEDYIRKHSYVTFYNNHQQLLLDGLARCEETNRLAVLHGDAFIDNVLFHPTSAELVGFVDFEDACVGPAVLDVAIGVVGNCFVDAVFNPEAMRDLVVTYYQEYLALGGAKDGMDQELGLLLTTMICITLVNASWRFTNFNITYPQYRSSHGEKYLELQKVVEYLESAEGSQVIHRIVEDVRAELLK